MDITLDERARLESLRQYHILDTAAESQFDNIVKLTQQICDAPIALISLVDQDRQWFKARLGITACETPRNISVCQYTILSDDLLEVPDTQLDGRFKDNPLVTGAPYMRFYAGAPLITSEGFRLGSLCVLDTRPRSLDASQREALKILAAQTVMLFEMHVAIKQKNHSDWRLSLALEASEVVGVYDWDMVQDKVFASVKFSSMFGIAPERAEKGVPVEEFMVGIHPDDRERVREAITDSIESGARFAVEYRLCNERGEITWVSVGGTIERDAAGKALRMAGIAIDISKAKEAQTKLQDKNLRSAALIELGDRLRDLKDTREIAHVAMEIVGRTLNVSRVGYATVDETGLYCTVIEEWLAQGIDSVAGTYELEDYGIQGTYLKEGRIFAVEDVLADSLTRDVASNFTDLGVAAILLMPIVEEELKAFLFLHASAIREWRDEDRQFVQDVSERLFATIDRRRLVKAAEDLAQQSEAVIDMQRRLEQTNDDFDHVLGIIVEDILKAIPAASGAVVELSEGDELVFRAVSGMAKEYQGWRIPAQHSLAGQAIREGQILTTHDATIDPRVHRLTVERTEMRSVIVIPLARRSEFIGALCIFSNQPRAFVQRDVTVAQLIVSAMIAGLSNVAETQTRRTLHEAREDYALIADSAHDFAIIALDARGRIVSWSKGARLIFGYEEEEAIGQPISMIFTPEDQLQHVYDHEMQTAAREGRAADERWHVTKSGTQFFASGVMAPMYDDDRNIRGFIKIARDMTLQHAISQQLIEARETAEAANMAKSEFLANMSHEIRTPMNAIIGLSGILAGSEPMTEKQRQFVTTLQMSADSLLALINDLLDISKIETRTVELERIPFSLTRMTQEVISMMGVRAREKGLQFTTETESIDDRSFLGDPTRLRQIVLNLCSNAVKFTDQGTIHIRITRHATDFHGIDTVVIQVADTGIGIAPEKLGMIFEKFTQADSSINRKYGGTGLGLAITKTLTEIMGGTIAVQSSPKGSVFTVSLPLMEIEPDAVKPEILPIPPRAAPIQNMGRVLLVEDQEPNILVATHILQGFGYDCRVAMNGTEAVAATVDESFDAILMDVQMHGMNGFEATVLIREREKREGLARTPIIGMTAHALLGDRERCLAVGMDDYLSKPFNPKDLLEKLRTASLKEAA